MICENDKIRIAEIERNYATTWEQQQDEGLELDSCETKQTKSELIELHTWMIRENEKIRIAETEWNYVTTWE